LEQNARDAVGLILREGVRVSLAAAGIGIGLSLLVGRLPAGMLVGVSAADPVVFGGAAAILVAISLVACWLPARRAARVKPIAELRME
jgi:ABC-type antimicrobial peptide transport system permease subunit